MKDQPKLTDTGAGPGRLRRLLNTLGPLLALVLIILGFAIASQIKAGLDDHHLLAERAARRARAGLPAEPVPTRWQCIREHENRFLTLDTFRATGNQTVSVGIAAMGMTMIIISGGIDLSVGSVIALTSVMTAWILKRGWATYPLTQATIPFVMAISLLLALLLVVLVKRIRTWPPFLVSLAMISMLFAATWQARSTLDILLAVWAGIVLGALCGLFNATMITRLKVVPFIATLGMWGIARGLAKGIAAEQKIDAPAGWLGTHVLVRQPEPSWLLVSPGVWAMLLLAVVVWAILRYTALGRYVFAIGSNEATARLCGIRVERVKLYLYSIAGLCTGLAGVMQFCRLTVGDPTTAMGAELDVIAAVVIGGGSLSGGEGSVFGSLIGALIMAFLRVGCDHVGVPTWVQEMVIGAVIVLAVAVDYIRRKSMT